MSAVSWALTGCAVVLLVFAAAMPWLDRRFTAAREVRAWRRACRGVTSGYSGPYAGPGRPDGLGDLWPGFGAHTAPSRPACGCWVHHLNAADLEAAINDIATHLNLTEGTDQ